MKKLKAIILAAGEGTRMRSKKPKVLHCILGKPMIDYVIETVKEAGVEEISVVIGHGASEVEKAVVEKGASTVLQKERRGTGHAVMQAESLISDDADIFVLYGDTPLIRAETLKQLAEFHEKEKNDVSIISAEVKNPTGYGRIIRDENHCVLKNVEEKDATEEERKLREINTGVYLYRGKALKDALHRLTNHNVQKEYYLPDTLALIRENGGRANAMLVCGTEEFFGINSRVQLAEAAAMLKDRINQFHMENGVTIEEPLSTYIGKDVKIGQDTVIMPGTMLLGSTEIGCDCLIGPYSRLTDMKVADGVTMQFSTALSSEIGRNTTVGPYAYIRPDCVVGDQVRLGDFVEIKNSVIGNGTKVSHLTYIGDADVGERINFGCGTVVVNYDGKKKYRTVIEDDVFLGCNTNLVAPVTVKKGAYTAAGSTITKEVPENSLAVARARQQNIPGWTKKDC